MDNTLRNALLFLWGSVLIICSIGLLSCGGGSSSAATGGPKATRTATATPTATSTPNLVLCPQDFALCAAATCEKTDGTITLNDGKTYPAVSCTCPVLPGPAIADLNAGNMKGSCTPPPDGVWSIYQIDSDIPQVDADPTWSEAPASALVCPGGLEFAQCWNLACTLGSIVNGQQLAICTCPLERAVTPFASESGLAGESICTQIPISAALAIDPNYAQ